MTAITTYRFVSLSWSLRIRVSRSIRGSFLTPIHQQSSTMSPPIDLYLAIDCGATKTDAVLCTPSGTVLARALGGGSNFSSLGLDAFLKRIGEVMSSALTTALQSSVVIVLPVDPVTRVDATGASMPPYNLRAAWLGVSGVDSSSATSLLLPHVSALLSVPVERLTITNDTHLLAAPLRILLDVRTAVAVVAGTGSIVTSFRQGAADAPPEAVARVGGWGWILGDEGGGFDVGRTAVCALLTQQDMESTGLAVAHGPLREKVLKKFGVSNVMNLLGVVYAPDSSSPLPREARVSSLCPLVFEAAFEDGDPLAVQVVRDCAHKLAMQITAVLLHPSAHEVRTPFKLIL
jgi:N-acetylglucosamine kinase-like BadF-type ATPase